MAGKPKNQEIGERGSDIIIDVTFRKTVGGDLIDPDLLPTFEILDPHDTIMSTGTGTKISLGVYHATYTIPSDAEISESWYIVWSATINGTLVQGIEYFRVVDVGAIPSDHDVIISDAWMYQIKKVLAYPKVLNIILNDLEIRTLCLYPAMREYFTKFPIKNAQQYSIDGELELSFPDIYTFGITYCSVVGKGETLGASSSFWDIVRFQQYGLGNGLGARGRGSYGTPYNFNQMRQNLHMQRQTQKSIENLATFKYRIDLPDKKLIAYSSARGEIVVYWAKWSDTFDDIKYERQFDVIKLAQANLLYHLADTGDIIEDTGAEQSLNTDALKSRAEELQNEVREKWLEFPDILVLRGA